MPSKYRIRNYQENSFYHIYNKGLGKANIFLDDKDYEKFLYYLEAYLMDPRLHGDDKGQRIPKRLLNKNLSHEVELIAYVLLPDHFHLILKQKSTQGISKLIKQVINGYTYYFNNKYKNSGSLFAGKFKSIQIPLDSLTIITNHLHAHPGILWLADNLKSYSWSSHHEYLKTKSSYLSKEYVLSQFSSTRDYEKLMESKIKYPEDIKGLLID